jgi:hypothetical protein
MNARVARRARTAASMSTPPSSWSAGAFSGPSGSPKPSASAYLRGSRRPSPHVSSSMARASCGRMAPDSSSLAGRARSARAQGRELAPSTAASKAARPRTGRRARGDRRVVAFVGVLIAVAELAVRSTNTAAGRDCRRLWTRSVRSARSAHRATLLLGSDWKKRDSADWP